MGKREVGVLAEKLAKDYLIKQGYKILHTNYRCPYGEIDIVASGDREAIFVEVRSRKSSSMGYPEESITPIKIERLKRAISYYLAQHPQKSWRLDVIVVEVDRENNLTRLAHIPNALV